MPDDTGTASPVAPGVHFTPAGAAWLPDDRAIVIADLHLGYARAARRRGGWLPDAEPPQLLASRVLELVRHHAAHRVVIAGDLRHSTRDADAGELADVAEFLALVGAEAEPVVVAGNHDRGATGMHDRLTLHAADVVHLPPDAAPGRFTICGHLHPSTDVQDATGAGARFPCALLGTNVLILPAFGAWPGGTRAERLRGALFAGSWDRLVPGAGRILRIAPLVVPARGRRSDEGSAAQV